MHLRSGELSDKNLAFEFTGGRLVVDRLEGRRRHFTIAECHDHEQRHEHERRQEDNDIEGFIECQVHEERTHQDGLDCCDAHYDRDVKGAKVQVRLSNRNDRQQHQGKKYREQRPNG